MELNQYDAELLNVTMEAFGRETILTRTQILELFNHDEAFAIPIVQALIAEKRVSPIGFYDIKQLPEAITNVLPVEKKAENLWIERAGWFLAGVLVTLLLGWLVMKLGHHHHTAMNK